MADKPVTVAVPEERVPEFYAWFARFLAAPAAGVGGPWGGGARGWAPAAEVRGWGDDDAESAAWLHRKLAPPARALVDLLADEPGRRWSGNELATRLHLDKGAHGVAGILAWPGRYCRKLGMASPITTEGRPDGGTDYWMDDDVSRLFVAARADPNPRGHEHGPPRRGGR